MSGVLIIAVGLYLGTIVSVALGQNLVGTLLTIGFTLIPAVGLVDYGLAVAVIEALLCEIALAIVCQGIVYPWFPEGQAPATPAVSRGSDVNLSGWIALRATCHSPFRHAPFAVPIWKRHSPDVPAVYREVSFFHLPPMQELTDGCSSSKRATPAPRCARRAELPCAAPANLSPAMPLAQSSTLDDARNAASRRAQLRRARARPDQRISEVFHDQSELVVHDAAREAIRALPALSKSIKCDVLIVGGGFSGISAAAEFLNQGLSVVLIEKNIAGGSSAGRSAGFLTPDSELELHQLVRRYGIDAAREIWEMPCRGIDRIVQAIKKNEIDCGLIEQDSLFLGLGKSGKEAVASELECRESVGFTDQQVYDENELKSVLGDEHFTAGIRYTGTYGINPLLCLQGFKDRFIENGMQVFESTEMQRLEDHTVYTHGGSVTADRIIIAVDKPTESISPLAREIFHAQTFMSVTDPLTDREIDLLFPSGKQMQCWDSRLVYSYWRLTGDNRLLLGGGTPITTFLKEAYNNPGVIKKVIKRFKRHFPALKDLSFLQFWPGLIDTTRDLLPIIVKPPTQPHLQFILGIVGLPWAAFAGSFAARNVLGVADEDYQKYYPYFSNRRHFVVPMGLASIIGKPALFSLTNGWAKFYQVDQHRKPVPMESEF